MIKPLSPSLCASFMIGGIFITSQADAGVDLMTPRIDVIPTNQLKFDEGTYMGSSTRVGKTLQDPHDIPQAVTTITKKIIEEQNAGSLKEALRNVSGLTFNAAEGGRAGDNMMLRGFYTFGDMYLDGIRDTAQYNRETFNLEQIDVLRGSAAMLFGRGQAGGVINQVTKTATLKDKNKITASLGQYDHFELKGDFNKKIGDTTAVRVNVMNRDEGSWRSNPSSGAEPDIDRQGLGLSISTGIATKNQWTFNYTNLLTNDKPDYGILFDSTTKRPTKNFPNNYYWGIDKNFDKSDTKIATLTHQYLFDETTELRTQVRYADYYRAYWAAAPNATTPSIDGVTGGNNKTRKSQTENITLQTDFNTQSKIYGMKHEILIGAEYLNEDAKRWSLLNIGSSGAPLYNENFTTSSSPTTYTGDTYALYAQDSIEFIPHWKLVLGGRRDELKAKYSSAASPRLSFGEWSLRTGLSWQPTQTAHYYLSFSDSFSPTADLYQISGAAYPPERSDVTEIGAKWLFMNGDLSFRSALYRANKEYERNTDLESSASILTNKRRTDGLEFEIAGRITSRWEIFGGIALMDSTILEVATNLTGAADSRLKGQTARNTPPYTVNVWSTYKLDDHWKVGGGIEAKGERYVYTPSTTNASSIFTSTGEFNPNTAPAYTRFDLMLAYEAKDYTLRANAQNIFDKVYYDQVYDNGGFTVPGTRQKLIFTAEYKF
jgi:catecholate siderophore receptor